MRLARGSCPTRGSGCAGPRRPAASQRAGVDAGAPPPRAASSGGSWSAPARPVSRSTAADVRARRAARAASSTLAARRARPGLAAPAFARRDRHRARGGATAAAARPARRARPRAGRVSRSRSQAAQNIGAIRERGARRAGARADRRTSSPTSAASSTALRPPVLDELGLAAALRAHADRLRAARIERRPPRPSCRCPPPPSSRSTGSRPRRSPTSSATRGAEHVPRRAAAIGGDHRARVDDDGRGFPAGRSPGVGLRSMRERAAELGGHVALGAAALGGLRVAVGCRAGSAVIRVLIVDDNASSARACTTCSSPCRDFEVAGGRRRRCHRGEPRCAQPGRRRADGPLDARG